MTEIAASDFRHPRRHVRLDTILRLRWLAVLGQLAAIFIVAQGLEFDVPIVPCLIIVGLSALLNLALQIAFNPMQRLEPAYAAALLALNIVELAALLFFTGGLQNPFSFLFLAPVLISATALPVRLTIALGMLAVACASVLVFYSSAAAMGQRRAAGAAADLSVRRLALDRGRDRGHQPLCVPGHRGGAQAFRRAGRDRTGAGPRAASDPARRARRRRRARARHAAVDDLPDLARAGARAAGQQPARRRHQDPARTGAALPRYPGQDHPVVLDRRAVRPHEAVDADRGDRGAASRFRRRHQGANRGRGRQRAGRHAQSGDPVWRRQHPGKRRRFRARRRSR